MWRCETGFDGMRGKAACGVRVANECATGRMDATTLGGGGGSGEEVGVLRRVRRVMDGWVRKNETRPFVIPSVVQKESRLNGKTMALDGRLPRIVRDLRFFILERTRMACGIAVEEEVVAFEGAFPLPGAKYKLHSWTSKARFEEDRAEIRPASLWWRMTERYRARSASTWNDGET